MKAYIYPFFILFFLFTAIPSWGQVPHSIPYQAAARNSSGEVLVSTNISVRFSIRDSIATGTIQYRETHNVTTTHKGMFAVNVGQGTVVAGTFANINWGANYKFLQVEIDPTGGSSYIDMGTQQLLSVPYALYAEKSGVPGAVDLPEIATGPVENISYTSAISRDTLKANGGEFVFARGVCIDTLPNPDINQSFTAPGNAVGSYAVSLTGLLPGRLYYIRAFATNSNGTAYGTAASFTTLPLTVPVVTTDTISHITNVSAFAGGHVTADGGSPVIARGICYSTSAHPTIANSTAPSGAGLGAFATTISGLVAHTTYYARAYATNAVGTAYGPEVSFTTILYSMPTVFTDSVTHITYTSATCGLNTSNDGNMPITGQGICYSTSPAPTIDGATIITAPSTAIGHYTLSMAGLTPGTTYYVRAYSTNDMGTAYGVQKTFTTSALTVPSVVTHPAIGITAVGATVGGAVTENGGTTIYSRGVCWSRFGTPTIDSAHTTAGGVDSFFTSALTGLTPGTTYYIVAYATNSVGTAYGTTLTFNTPSTLAGTATLPVLGTKPPTAGSSTVTSGGYITDGGSAITARGVCWSTSPNPTIADAHTNDTAGMGLGYFNSTLSLSGCGIVYYVRAYATNSYGTAYGNEYTVTSGFLPTVSPITIVTVTPTSVALTYEVISDGGCPLSHNYCEMGLDFGGFHITSEGETAISVGVHTVTFSSLIPNVTYRVSAVARNERGYGWSDGLTTFTTGFPTAGHYIGESYAGGIIFYLDATGEHGLVCAPNDHPVSALWGGGSISVAGTLPDIGSGATNTAYIVAADSYPFIAAQICANLTLGGYSDWYLPSKDELTLLSQNLALHGLGGFSTEYSYPTYGFYWSSTQESTSHARANKLTRPSGSYWDYESIRSKSDYLNVRAIRSF